MVAITPLYNTHYLSGVVLTIVFPLSIKLIPTTYLSPVISHQQQELIVRAVLEAVPDTLAIWLYGSRAGDSRYVGANSDYDIAYYVDDGHPMVSSARFQLAHQLSMALGIDHVDLVDLRGSVSHALRINIIDGVKLWEADH